MTTSCIDPPSARALLDRLTEKGARFSLREGRLAVNVPRGLLTDADVEALRARKAELLDLVVWEITKTDGPVRDAAPDLFAHFRGPRRTWWGSLVWSDPDAPPLELFGPAVPDDLVAAPVPEPAEPPDPWPMTVHLHRKRGRR